MLVECVSRPELRAPVLELIGRVRRAHTGGEFTLALSEMFSSFGLSLGATEWAKLRARGDVRFSPQSASQGIFVNQGVPRELPTDEGLTIVIPETISGDYITTETSLTLKFAEGSALRGCKR